MNRITLSLRWLYGLTLVLIGASFFWGYCWNWWAQDKLWQFLFQEYCPAASEEARYPANTDVLVSARVKPIGAFSLLGNRWMEYSRVADSDRYLYDFQSGTTVVANLPEQEKNQVARFITDEWMVIFTEHDTNSLTGTANYLLNWKTEQRIPLTTHQIQGGVDAIPPELMTLLRESPSIVIFLGGILALPTPIEDGSASNGTLIRYMNGIITSGEATQDAGALQEFGVTAIPIGGAVSTDGRFYFRHGGANNILSSATQQPVVLTELQGLPHLGSGWAYRDQGIIISSGNYTLIGEVLGWIRILQPILLLRQDTQYLPPDIQAEFAARDAEEARNRQWAGVALAVLLAGTAAMGAFTVRAHWRRARRETEVQYAGA